MWSREGSAESIDTLPLGDEPRGRQPAQRSFDVGSAERQVQRDATGPVPQVDPLAGDGSDCSAAPVTCVQGWATGRCYRGNVCQNDGPGLMSWPFSAAEAPSLGSHSSPSPQQAPGRMSGPATARCAAGCHTPRTWSCPVPPTACCRCTPGTGVSVTVPLSVKKRQQP